MRSQLCRKLSEPVAVSSCAPASPLVAAAARRNADLAEVSDTKPEISLSQISIETSPWPREAVLLGYAVWKTIVRSTVC